VVGTASDGSTTPEEPGTVDKRTKVNTNKINFILLNVFSSFKIEKTIN